MSKNNGFKKIMKQQLLEKCRRSGIDPQLIDIEKYDFDSFNSVNDLIEYYASLGDTICKKILSSEQEFSDDYISYLEGKMNEYNDRISGEKRDEEIEKLREEVESLKTSIQNLENRILDRSNWLNDYFSREIKEIREDVEAIRKEKNSMVSRSIEAIRKELKDQVDQVFDYKFKGMQSYLTEYLDSRIDEKLGNVNKPATDLDLNKIIKIIEEKLDEKLKNIDVKPINLGSIDINEVVSRAVERKLNEVTEKVRGLEEMVTYGTKRAVETYDQLKRSHEELGEKYLDLVSKYESLIQLIEKASTPTRQIQEGERTEGKLDLDELVRIGVLRTAKPKRRIDWKKVGIQVLKGIYLGLICVPLLPFLPLLYNNLVKEVRSGMKARTRKGKRGAEVWLKP